MTKQNQQNLQFQLNKAKQNSVRLEVIKYLENGYEFELNIIWPPVAWNKSTKLFIRYNLNEFTLWYIKKQ